MDRTQVEINGECEFNSKDYLEMSNHLQEIYNRDKDLSSKYKKKYNRLYKQIVILWGLIETYVINDSDPDFDIFIGEAKTICESIIFRHIEDDE